MLPMRLKCENSSKHGKTGRCWECVDRQMAGRPGSFSNGAAETALSLCIPFRTEDLEKQKARCRSSAGASIADRLIVIPFRLISLHLVPAKHASSYTASGANKAILARTVELQTAISQAHAFPGAAPLGRKGIRWAVCSPIDIAKRAAAGNPTAEFARQDETRNRLALRSICVECVG